MKDEMAGKRNSSSAKVAVLMATYNGEAWIHQQIDSIFAQCGCLVRIYINDDGSSDRTLAVLRTHPRFGELRITRVRCGGAGQNFIHLLREIDCSRYDYVALSDQDDFWVTNKLERAIGELKLHSADAYSSNVTACWPDGGRRLIVKSQRQRRFDYMFESAGPGCTFVLTRSTANAIRGFLNGCPAEELAKVALHDWLIYGFVRGGGGQWIIDDFSALNYRQHGQNVLGASSGPAALRKRWHMISHGWYFDQARRNARLIGINNSPSRLLCRGHLADLFSCLVHTTELRRLKSESILVAFALCLYWLGFVGSLRDSRNV